jgi:thiamine biosynthesis lipoprotein
MTFEATRFAAMGTEVDVLAAPALPPDAEAVEALFASVEARFSRFRRESELSLLNLSAGSPFAASPMFLEVLNAALIAAAQTDGLFDPLVLPHLEAAGYRQSIEAVKAGVQAQTAVRAGPTFRDVEVSGDGTVTIPAGSGLDFGGFVKGWTVDRAATLLKPAGNWCINAGGDLLARGAGPDGDGWLVGVEDPLAPERDAAVIRLRNQAAATSSTVRRRWTTQAGTAHHIIDPRTGRPSETDLACVTVVTASVAAGEVLAKQLLLLGSQATRDYAECSREAVLLIDRAGSLTYSRRMENYVVV